MKKLLTTVSIVLLAASVYAKSVPAEKVEIYRTPNITVEKTTKYSLAKEVFSAGENEKLTLKEPLFVPKQLLRNDEVVPLKDIKTYLFKLDGLNTTTARCYAWPYEMLGLQGDASLRVILDVIKDKDDKDVLQINFQDTDGQSTALPLSFAVYASGFDVVLEIYAEDGLVVVSETLK